MPLKEFLGICKENLRANGLRYYDAGLPVKRIAVMGGSGGDCAALAKSLGCDTYVTADIKYDQFLLAREIGLNLIDADHFCTENVIVPKLMELVKQQFPDLEVSVSRAHGQTAEFF
jgi:putative NIF3 family GTP cyclohydrolase 1 type 2